MSDETLTMDSVIDEEVIEACRKAGACAVALMWVKAKPRTYRQLRDHSLKVSDWSPCTPTSRNGSDMNSDAPKNL